MCNNGVSLNDIAFHQQNNLLSYRIKLEHDLETTTE